MDVDLFRCSPCAARSHRDTERRVRRDHAHRSAAPGASSSARAASRRRRRSPSARARVGMDGVQLDEATRTVRFRRPGLELNLGSIGKGWALDRAGSCCGRRGVSHALALRGRQQRARPGRPRRGMARGRALAPGRNATALPASVARLRSRHEWRRRAVRGRGRPALWPRPRSPHRLAGVGSSERERRGRRGGAWPTRCPRPSSWAAPGSRHAIAPPTPGFSLSSRPTTAPTTVPVRRPRRSHPGGGMNDGTALSSAQQTSLVLLRTLVGWHFLYEGFVKLWKPAWGRTGEPLAAFSAAGYLHAGSGPLAPLFQRLAEPPWIGPLSQIVAVALVFVGLSLMLGLFTRLGTVLGLLLLLLFYAAAIPTRPAAGQGGGHLPLREQDTHRGGRHAGAARLRHRPHRRARHVARGASSLAPASAGEASVMNLTPEQQALGRRNFLRALAGTPALAALGAAAGHARAREGRARAASASSASGAGPRAARADGPGLRRGPRPVRHPSRPAEEGRRGPRRQKKLPPARHYAEWKEMLAKEDLEARRGGALRSGNTPRSWWAAWRPANTSCARR